VCVTGYKKKQEKTRINFYCRLCVPACVVCVLCILCLFCAYFACVRVLFLQYLSVFFVVLLCACCVCVVFRSEIWNRSTSGALGLDDIVAVI
jgi:hypothetical protein